MKFKYRPWATGELVEFDPGNEIICPGCGSIKPVPFGWRTHQTIVICRGTEETHTHSIAMFDINSILGDFETNEDDGRLLAYKIEKGIVPEEDVRQWCERRTMWHIMHTGGSLPKWKVEPDPFWRRTLAESMKNKHSNRNVK